MPVPARTTAHAVLATACLLALGAAPAASAATNLALTGTASQSSTYPGGDAGNAIDGDTNGSWWDGSVASTTAERNPWWQVQLAQAASIDTVVVWNRTDCCGDRLSGVTLSLWLAGQQVAAAWIADAPAPSTAAGFGHLLADTVRLERVVDIGFLNAAEVQVFGQIPAVPEPKTWMLMVGGLAAVAALARRRAAR